MITLFAILFIAIILFALEIFPVDKTALLMLGAMVLFELVSAEEAIQGFANPAVITILSLMILAHALEKNGVIAGMVRSLAGLRKSPLVVLVPVFMLITGSISAFISTTAVVVVFIKLINRLSEQFQISKSKLLMPISFAGILGGSCTLMGTSTNLIVSSIAVRHGVPPMEFFEFTFPGVIVLLAAVIIIGFLSIKLLPRDEAKKVVQDYHLEDFLTRVRLIPQSPEVDQPIYTSDLAKDEELEILQLSREDYTLNYPDKNIELHVGDILLVRASLEAIGSLSTNSAYEILDSKETKEQLKREAASYSELLVLPNSSLIGKSLKNLARAPLAGAIPLAIRKRKKWLNALTPNQPPPFSRGHQHSITLNVGDTVLVETLDATKDDLASINNVMLINEYDSPKSVVTWKRTFSFLVLALVVGLAALGITSILKSVLIGVFFLLVFRCLDLNEAYGSINWQVIFLLAGMIPIGTAMQNTGADQFLINSLYNWLKNYDTIIILSSIFLITQIASGFISNNAVAIVMTPVALGLAEALNLPAHALIIAVAFAANFSFFTPVGYQTNTLIYSMGIYRFKDFILLGGVLSLLSAVLAILLIQYLYL